MFLCRSDRKHPQIITNYSHLSWGGAMVLGKLPMPGRPTIWITVGQGPTALAVGAGGGCLDIFTLIYPFFPLSPSLWETARYRLKYCLKGPLNPKQPTNQPTHLSRGCELYVLIIRNNIVSSLRLALASDLAKAVTFLIPKSFQW